MLLSILSKFPLALLVSYLSICKAAPQYNVLNGANFPDPSIVNVKGVSYVFGTPDGAGHYTPMTHNRNFNNAAGWSAITDAFPPKDVPAFGKDGWAVKGTSWAPDVNHLVSGRSHCWAAVTWLTFARTDYDGSFAMYYSPALKSNTGIHCIGLARGLKVEGPYNDSSTAPLICPEAEGGAIDASGYLDDDNKRYVVYKIDGPAVNNGGYCASPDNKSYNTSLMFQQVENDAYTLVGSPVVLYNNQGVKDKYNVEAPVIVKSTDGTYFLFFSSDCTFDNSYTVSYVTSTSGIWGPYGHRKTLLQTGDYGLYSPGGADIDQATGEMVFHSFTSSDNFSDGRVLDTATITLKKRSVLIN